MSSSKATDSGAVSAEEWVIHAGPGREFCNTFGGQADTHSNRGVLPGSTQICRGTQL